MSETTVPPAAPTPIDHEARTHAARAVALQLLQGSIGTGAPRYARNRYSSTIGWLLAAIGFRWAWLVTSTDDTVPPYAYKSLLDKQVKPPVAVRVANFHNTIMDIARDLHDHPLESLHAQAAEVLGSDTTATVILSRGSHAHYAKQAHDALALLLAHPQHAPYARLIPRELMWLCAAVLAYWGVHPAGDEAQRHAAAVDAVRQLANRQYPLPEAPPPLAGDPTFSTPPSHHRPTHSVALPSQAGNIKSSS